MMSELVMHGRVGFLFVLDNLAGSVICVRGLFFWLIMISGDFSERGLEAAVIVNLLWLLVCQRLQDLAWYVYKREKERG